MEANAIFAYNVVVFPSPTTHLSNFNIFHSQPTKKRVWYICVLCVDWMAINTKPSLATCSLPVGPNPVHAHLCYHLSWLLLFDATVTMTTLRKQLTDFHFFQQHSNMINCDCLKQNQHNLHLPVFQEIPFQLLSPRKTSFALALAIFVYRHNT